MVFKQIRHWLKPKQKEDDCWRLDGEAPSVIEIDGRSAFKFQKHIALHEGYPIVDWGAVYDVENSVEPGQFDKFWEACELGWLLHFRDALGEVFHLTLSEHVAVLSSFPFKEACATVRYIERTFDRILRQLDGIAQRSSGGRDILIIFDDSDAYYRYVIHTYPEHSEFAFSSGMFLGRGCPHFVLIKSELAHIEPTIVHEMTHSCLSHLPLPAWLNEGIAVNTEQVLCRRKHDDRFTPFEMHRRHQEFWNSENIQDFWSGEAFHRNDQQEYAYSLAQIMVEQMGRNWRQFISFVLESDWQDAGVNAAQKHLDIDLGVYVCALLEKTYSTNWSPSLH